MIGYHASHEQFKPSELLSLAKMAEEAGFTSINCSDHFNPWSERQGQSGFSFAWLGAAMQQSRLPFGVVCAPGQRYHPAIVAQAGATLAEMFPDRFWMSLGSGEALNEKITGQKWPEKPERNARLQECVEVMKRLFNGETVTHYGRVVVENAKLYTLPQNPPQMVGAAVTEETVKWMAGWTDGLITVHKPYDELKKLVATYRNNGGEGKPIFLKVQLSYAHTEEEALSGAHDQWRTNIFSGSILGDMWRVEQFDAMGEFVQPEELKDMVHISTDLEYYRNVIEQYVDLGFERIILHNVNRQQVLFIKDFGEQVLPHFNKK